LAHQTLAGRVIPQSESRLFWLCQNSVIRDNPVRQAKLGCSSKMKGVCHVNWMLNMKLPKRQREVTLAVEALGETSVRAVATSELKTASIHENGNGQALGLSEARTSQEETFECTGWISRGERRQRVRKEQTGTWERPEVALAEANQSGRGINNSTTCRNRETERLVVVMKRSNFRGAKEPWQKRCGVRRTMS